MGLVDWWLFFKGAVCIVLEASSDEVVEYNPLVSPSPTRNEEETMVTAKHPEKPVQQVLSIASV